MTTEKLPTGNDAARWTLLLFRFAGKLAVFALFLVYIFVGTSSAMDLYARNKLRAQDINALYAVIEDATHSGDFRTVTAWVKARPLAETDTLVKMIIPKSPALEYSTFYEIAQREVQLERPEEALFWLQLSRFRLRYDTIRCGASAASIKAFDRVMDLMQLDAVSDLIATYPSMQKAAVQKVLDFDEKYPAHNNPLMLCKTISVELPVEEQYWENFRKLLRPKTTDFLQSPDKTNFFADKKITAPADKK